MEKTVIDLAVLYGLVGIAGISSIALIGLLFFIGTNPIFRTILSAHFKKTPLIQVHTALKQTKLYAGQKGGKHKNANVYKIPEYGIKFTPLPDMVEHIGSTRHINYYSKAAFALSPKALAAFRDIDNLLRAKGIQVTETLLDTLLVMTNDEIVDLYSIEVNTLQNEKIVLSANDIIDIRDELKQTYIKDGQFVWETARNYIFLLQTETSRSLDEYIAIVREQALDDARLGVVDKEGMRNIIIIITLIMGMVIAYKMLVG
jgi:hypothetical protein